MPRRLSWSGIVISPFGALTPLSRMSVVSLKGIRFFFVFCFCAVAKRGGEKEKLIFQ